MLWDSSPKCFFFCGYQIHFKTRKVSLSNVSKVVKRHMVNAYNPIFGSKWSLFATATCRKRYPICEWVLQTVTLNQPGPFVEELFSKIIFFQT